MQDQIAILNEMADLIFNEVNESFEKMNFKGEVNPAEGWFKSSFAYYVNGSEKSVHLSRPAQAKMTNLSFNLHKAMSEHTGGEWKWFTLELDQNGQAKTHFEY